MKKPSMKPMRPSGDGKPTRTGPGRTRHRINKGGQGEHTQVVMKNDTGSRRRRENVTMRQSVRVCAA